MAYVHSNKNLRPKQESSLIHVFVFKDLFSKFVDFLPPAFRRNGEGYVFTGVCPSTPMGRGTPIWPGGYPLPRSGWGRVPHPRSGQGGNPFQVRQGRYPFPGQDGVPHPMSGQGVTPSHVRTGGYPIQGQNRVYPFPGPRMGGTHPRSEWGVPLPRSGQGVPRVPPFSGMEYPHPGPRS